MKMIVLCALFAGALRFGFAEDPGNDKGQRSHASLMRIAL